jgi:hypothetical protein
MKKAAVPSILIAVVLLALAVTAEAQQPKRTSRIGLLSGSGPTTNPAALEAFRQGLRELGYVEGGNIVLLGPKTVASSPMALTLWLPWCYHRRRWQNQIKNL